MVVASLLYAVCLYRAYGALDTLSPYIYYELLHLGCKKGEANQKQQLSDYEYIHSYIAILVTKSFDIKVRPRIS